MNTLPDECVDLIIAYPPYYKICGEFDFIWDNVDEYIEWCKQWTLECERILKPNGSFYMWGAIGYNIGFPLFKIIDFSSSNLSVIFHATSAANYSISYVKHVYSPGGAIVWSST
jgi:DNA modification methylase